MSIATEGILLLILLAFWTAGWLVLGRVRRCGWGNAGKPISSAPLSIIIPARNEEKNLPVLLRSLAAQTIRPAEIIVVDDASTDRTAEVAREFGARVVSSQPLPAGWRGKTWACQQGAQAATGEWLLFLDADTWFEVDGLRRVLAEFQALGGGVLSVAPHHAVRAFHEQFSVFFNLLMLAGTGGFTLLGDRRAPSGLLGQFLLIEAATYARVGGHGAVRGRILENFWFAETLRAVGVPLRCRGGRGVFSFRMYPLGWRELTDGWIKGFAAGAGQTPLPLLLLTIAWLSGLVLATIVLLLAHHALLGIFSYGFYAAQVAWLMRPVGTFHWATALLFPAPLAFYFIIFTRSIWRAARKQPVTWKDRQIHAD
jgi:4,4'-diaponeurosporenoate glycosyltransferase